MAASASPLSESAGDPARAPKRRSGTRRRHRHRLTRTPWAHKAGDLATEIILYAMLVFAPWAFGTTQPWSTWLLNLGGYALGVLWLAKWGVRWSTGFRPDWWWGTARDPAEDEETEGSVPLAPGVGLTRVLAGLTVLILLYCLVSALNARALYRHDWLGFEYFDAILWLPHSYDQGNTFYGFFKYLALACVFWSVRDWVGAKTRHERAFAEAEEAGEVGAVPDASARAARRWLMPERLQRVLWVLAVNGVVLAMACMLQRFSGENRLLFFLEPRFGDASSHFGPFAYRGTGAQYFNLLWPACLGFWWVLRERHQARNHQHAPIGSGPHLALLPMVVFMGACPTITTSRGGALISYLALIASYIGLHFLSRGRRSQKTGVLLLTVVGLLAFGLYFGWTPLSKRLEGLKDPGRDASTVERLEQYANTRSMIHDHPWFGIGPHAYDYTYQLYLAPGQQNWYPFAHNDWLQLVAEWGGIGAAMIILALVSALALPFARRIGNWVMAGTLLVSLATVLLHGWIDFPLQVYSIVFTFLVLLAGLISLPAAEPAPNTEGPELVVVGRDPRPFTT